MNIIGSSLSKRDNLFIAIVLLLMGVVNYLLTSVNPLRFDDLLFQYFCTDNIPEGQVFLFDHSHKIESFPDVLKSVTNHSFLLTGRGLNIFFVQLFCSIIDKSVFDIINAIVYVLFLIGCLRLANTKNITNSIIVIGVLWFILPVQQIFTMSIAFAVNYLWPATLIVYFLLMLRTCIRGQETKTPAILLISVFGFICGYTHELFTAPLSASLFVYTIINRKTINKQTFAAIVGFWLGTIFILIAPATWNRASTIIASSDTQEVSFLVKLQFLIYSKRFFLLLFSIATSYFIIGREKTLAFTKKHVYMLLAIVLGLISLSLIPHYSQRMSFPVEFFSVLIGINLLLYFKIKEKIKKVLCIIVITLMLIHIPITIYYSNKVVEEYHYMVNLYLSSEDGKTHYYKDFELPKYVSPYVERLRLPFEAETISFNYGKTMVVEE